MSLLYTTRESRCSSSRQRRNAVSRRGAAAAIKRKEKRSEKMKKNTRNPLSSRPRSMQAADGAPQTLHRRRTQHTVGTGPFPFSSSPSSHPADHAPSRHRRSHHLHHHHHYHGTFHRLRRQLPKNTQWVFFVVSPTSSLHHTDRTGASRKYCRKKTLTTTGDGETNQTRHRMLFREA